ncbi:MAG: type II toxin-antitoxin system RelE/ParE family toxin [Oscillospiraceae bacterium]|jgi:hypothetical protein|nr:type II toxin-antitoxin system RelE/ParE family toxin [Oscillospiraceae bacterium]
MNRTFIMTPQFDKQWEKMGLTDNDLHCLQLEILENPKVGTVIQGTGGLRKMRFALNDRGKSGGARVVYVDFVIYRTVYLIHAYPKSEKEDMTDEERKNLCKAVKQIEQALARRNST